MGVTSLQIAAAKEGLPPFVLIAAVKFPVVVRAETEKSVVIKNVTEETKNPRSSATRQIEYVNCL